MPAAWLVSKLHQSCTHLRLPQLQHVNKDGEKRRGEVRGAERQGEEAREGGRQRKTVSVFDADELGL